MKILCICNGGNNRSVALAWAFKTFNEREMDRLPYEDESPPYLNHIPKQHEVITIGAYHIKASTLRLLEQWCDIAISACTQKIVIHLKEIFKWKYNQWDVGEDKFGTPYHPLLLEKALDKARSVLAGKTDGWK